MTKNNVYLRDLKTCWTFVDCLDYDAIVPSVWISCKHPDLETESLVAMQLMSNDFYVVKVVYVMVTLVDMASNLGALVKHQDLCSSDYSYSMFKMI